MNRLFQELGNEVGPQLKDSEAKEQTINERLKALQEKMMIVVKVKCNEAYSWFEKNAIQSDSGFKITEENKNEGQKYMKELQECSAKFDFGLRDEMQNVESDILKISETHQACSTNCIENPESKKDEEIKNCFKNCFNQTFVKTDKIQVRLVQKIDDAIFNLNKI